MIAVKTLWIFMILTTITILTFITHTRTCTHTHIHVHTHILLRQDLNRQVQEYNQTILQTQQDLHHLYETTQRKEDAIREQQEEIHRLRSQMENPYWVLQRNEIEMTNEILGKGGWGEVKVAIFRGTKAAAKCLHEVIIAEHNLHLFSREMDIASRVRHPNLLQFIGATRVGNPIILTELMPTSLRKELEKGPLTRLQILTIGRDVSAALNYLHLWKPLPILHRDVSSANVLLEPSVNRRWKGKLCDYGSANFLHQVSTVAPGSLVYSAPEAISPHLHSPAMDVYSFGILLLEMATCRLPSTISFEREEQICEVQYPYIKSLVERCTSHDQQFRPKIGKVLEDINAI